MYVTTLVEHVTMSASARTRACPVPTRSSHMASACRIGGFVSCRRPGVARRLAAIRTELRVAATFRRRRWSRPIVLRPLRAPPPRQRKTRPTSPSYDRPAWLDGSRPGDVHLAARRRRRNSECVRDCRRRCVRHTRRSSRRRSHVRGQTLYSPDSRTPLHPPSIGEAASIRRQDAVRPALVWTIDLDATAAKHRSTSDGRWSARVLG